MHILHPLTVFITCKAAIFPHHPTCMSVFLSCHFSVNEPQVQKVNLGLKVTNQNEDMFSERSSSLKRLLSLFSNNVLISQKGSRSHFCCTTMLIKNCVIPKNIQTPPRMVLRFEPSHPTGMSSLAPYFPLNILVTCIEMPLLLWISNDHPCVRGYGYFLELHI